MADPVEELADGVARGDRRSLARAITLVESTRRDHRAQAETLVDRLLPRTGKARRVGISGAPGAGKSSFVEALGLHLGELGHSVAVLAVDPTSQVSGGSVLGDKTRMELLAREPYAYIRPSPSKGMLGGIAPRTREAMLLCEAAGFDVILIETVGVGQSETDVEALVDCFVLLVAPGGGDQLQGIKRGVMELADVVAVTKADGDLMAAANHSAAEHRRALHLMRPKHAGWQAPVVLTSALERRGLDETWNAVEDLCRHLGGDGRLGRRRNEQARGWFWSEVRVRLVDELSTDSRVSAVAKELEAAVVEGTLSPGSGATRLLAARSEDPAPG